MPFDIVKSGPGEAKPEDVDKQRRKAEDRINEFVNILETVDLDMSDVNLDERAASDPENVQRAVSSFWDDMKREMRRGETGGNKT